MWGAINSHRTKKLKNINHNMTSFTFAILAFLLAFSQPATAQKAVFLPDSLRIYDLNDTTSRWCWQRSAQTDDLVFFWEKGFGDDLANAPQLDGHDMRVDLPNLKSRVQHFYRYFRDTLRFTLPGSKADRYKMMVMIHYSLEGTAYGGTYDNFIGALWVAPNRIQDRKLNCLAHELGHSFQLQIPADSVGDAWGGSGFFEMASQWMLWQVNPDWVKDEYYHFEAFSKLTHKAFLHLDNIYHSPYVLEYWSELRGLPSIGELFRQGRKGEDPVLTYQRLYGLTQQQFCMEMAHCYQHLLNFDFTHARKETRPYACTFSTPVGASTKKRWYAPASGMQPEDYGFNAIRLNPEVCKRKVSATLRGEGLISGFVAVGTDGQAYYGPLVTDGKPKMALPKGKQLKALYLLVTGAPAVHTKLDYRHPENNANYPYTFRLSGAEILK